jgi:hypothetical protein
MCVRVLRQIEHLSLPAIKGIHPLFLHSLDLFLPFTFIPSSPAGSSSGEETGERPIEREIFIVITEAIGHVMDGLWMPNQEPASSSSSIYY